MKNEGDRRDKEDKLMILVSHLSKILLVIVISLVFSDSIVDYSSQLNF